MNSSDSEKGFFPEEVILQILARLPIKSLYKCKSVCKNWYRIPSQNYFITLYNDISSKNPMILVEVIKSFYVKSSYICVDRFKGVGEFSLDFIKSDRVKVRASCNGLLCCASIPNKGVYYVCNPMTKEYKLLPKTRERPMTRFHPDDEATLVGLGVDMVKGKFNVVLAGFYRPFGRRPLDSFVCLVYDSEVNCWKRSVTSLNEEFTHMNKNQVVFVNGYLHWLTYSCMYVLVFDIENDVWSKILLPKEVVNGCGHRVHLLELDGFLSMVQISDSWMTIWVLKDYAEEEWYETDKVSLRCIKGLVPSVFPISQTSEFVLLATQRQILVYHRKSRFWKEMYSAKNSSTYPLWFSAHAFKSTIFSCRDGAVDNSS
ncbi:hypothetical protein C5167_011858 [Papaver somniferum]|uniref:F-box domain-containing protein n=1 Tax=Papaver somniferum TaxID=3469 RepID=A0A4Y7J020_PAPSO|nr:F-box protein At5g49610-like [Papaver somniferum]XP_026453686.1 F-box protein At5g49610-like [Papaver somniferum]XP_026453687.1 F-box protein At5g49610-like [Papaver somniferum]RZC53005.1 hypothetical protein C5167_011858 [Papaver somniferum]